MSEWRFDGPRSLPAKVGGRREEEEHTASRPGAPDGREGRVTRSPWLVLGGPAALLALLLPVALAAQSCPDGSLTLPTGPAPEPGAVMESLLGSWEGSGTLMGAPARFRMTWSSALGGRFLRLDFENAVTSEDGGEVPVLSATAFYRLTADGPMPGTWVDDRGAILSLCGRRTGDAFVVTWSGAGETGRTAYRPGPDGRVEVVDSVRTAGGWREFGSARYVRSDPAVERLP